ncbi:MAG: adenylate/guanylate cyclase domain-containing protein [Deltaproteobacteria bacterium]|nr:adenylate/guanylate cyclase domain-containing protein [Deltaproteobacteria bacterium]MBW2309046.1 adenylate/guanylate cyclase domain-containing protein [Deltaproteobacteria bacterium]
MEEIARRFKGMDFVGESRHNGHAEEAFSPKVRSLKSDRSSKIDGKGLELTIKDIYSPAYLVNNNFEIEWINREAEDQVFDKSVSSIAQLESRNIFKLFFSWEFHDHLRNWEEIIAFHMKVIKSKLPMNHITSLYHGISEREISLLEKMYDNEIAFPEKSINNFHINFVTRDGSIEYYQVYTVFFREGIFFVYVPANREIHFIMDFLSSREKVINELLRQRMPSLVSLCVIVADLQDSVKISAELLPGEYFELINNLWKTLASSFEKYYGIYGKHAGDGMLYYFIKKPGSNYIMDAIYCALELRDKMKTFSNEWKVRKGWLNDIYLNIGINEGEEYFGTIHSASNIEFTALGDSINYAGRLSDFSRFGTIWTTKNVINKLDQEELKKISFGIRRKEHEREIFIQNSFARLIDLLDTTDKQHSRFLDIAALPITEIIDRI